MFTIITADSVQIYLNNISWTFTLLLQLNLRTQKKKTCFKTKREPITFDASSSISP